MQQIINLGLSGFSYGAADVSGFAGGPSADLLTRWFEIGAFYPVFRDHFATGTPRVEPWVDGPDHLAIRRRFIEERYRLMPYLYALADRNARAGRSPRGRMGGRDADIHDPRPATRRDDRGRAPLTDAVGTVA